MVLNLQLIVARAIHNANEPLGIVEEIPNPPANHSAYLSATLNTTTLQDELYPDREAMRDSSTPLYYHISLSVFRTSSQSQTLCNEVLSDKAVIVL